MDRPSVATFVAAGIWMPCCRGWLSYPSRRAAARRASSRLTSLRAAPAGTVLARRRSGQLTARSLEIAESHTRTKSNGGLTAPRLRVQANGCLRLAQTSG